MTLESFASGLDNLFNPIIVKELRQAVRGRFLGIVLILFLIVEIIVLTLGITNSTTILGSELTSFLLGVLLFVCILMIPGYMGFKLVREHADNSNELLYITTITPQTIIRGKLGAALMQVVLFYSVCAPFIGFAFFLRGTDLFTVFWILCLGFGVSAILILFQIFFAELPLSPQFRTGLGFVEIWINIYVFAGLVAISNEFLLYGLGIDFTDPNSLGYILYTALVLVLLGGFVYSLAVAAVSLPTTNRSLCIRKYLCVAWIINLAVISVTMGGTSLGHIVFAGTFVFQLIFSAMFFSSVSEREEIGKSIQKTIPAGMVRKLLCFIFYSGAAGGIAWCTIMSIINGLIFYGTALTFPPSPFYSNSLSIVLFLLPIYAGFYALAGNIIRRMFPGKIPLNFSWLPGLILMVMIAIITAFLDTSYSSSTNSIFFYLSPFTGINERHGATSLPVAALAFAIALAANIPWLLTQYTRFMRCRNNPGREGS